jgi:cyclopropane fatty-acyl-phospholipid synthase-like methyltransferase
MSESYHDTRLEEDSKRDTLWSVLAEYLQRYIAKDSSVLDFGAGYCGFINSIKASDKHAYDIWDGINTYSNDEVNCIIGDEKSFSTLQTLDNEQFDIVFASNIFEHFTVDELNSLLDILSSKMKVGGKLIVIQPNYFYAYRKYFDDYTHKSVWTHNSFSDFVRTKGFNILQAQAKFMPLTVKSRFPVHRLLIKLYLLSPIKPLAGQMLFVCEKK